MNITLSLPAGCRTLLSVGDKIEPDTQVYEVKKKKNITVNVAETLKVKPETIFRYLQKIIGEEVQKGDIIATKKGMVRTRRVIASHDAVIKEISHISGSITLLVEENESVQTTFSTNQTIPYILKGIVEKIDTNSITISVKNATQIPVKNVTSDCAAELFYFKSEGYYFTANEDDLKNKLVVVEVLKSHIEVKCEALGCSGFVFVSGQPTTELPVALLPKKESYDTIVELKKKFGILTKINSQLVVYD